MVLLELQLTLFVNFQINDYNMIGWEQWRKWYIPSMALAVDAPEDHDLAGCRKQPLC